MNFKWRSNQSRDAQDLVPPASQNHIATSVTEEASLLAVPGSSSSVQKGRFGFSLTRFRSKSTVSLAVQPPESYDPGSDRPRTAEGTANSSFGQPPTILLPPPNGASVDAVSEPDIVLHHGMVVGPLKHDLDVQAGAICPKTEFGSRCAGIIMDENSGRFGKPQGLDVTNAGPSPGLATNPQARVVGTDSSSNSQAPFRTISPPRESGADQIRDTSGPSSTVIPILQRKGTIPNQRGKDSRIPDSSRQLWEAAFNRLDDSDKDTLRPHIETPLLTSTGAILIADALAIVESVTERKIEIERKRGGMLTFSWKGRVFNLTKVMDDIVAWADRFKVIGDTIVQYDPGHMALPWATARFLLQILTADRANMAAITITIERVTNVSTLSAIYVGMYLDHRILSTICYNRLESSLIKLHHNILSILARAVRYLKHKRAVVRSLFDYDSFEDHLLDINHNLQDLREDVRIAEGEIMNLNYQWEQENYSRLKLLLVGLGHTLEKLERSAEALEKDMQEKRRNDLLTWISACPYKRQHQDVLGGEAIMENTGEWLFKTNEFIDWIETPGTSVLWLNGEPGVGKSHLTYAVIEFLQTLPTNHLLAYFYCSRRDNDRARTDPEALIRAILKALLVESGVDPEIVLLETRYKQRNDRGELSVAEAQKYLLELLQQSECHASVILIDALDEFVDRKDRKRLLTAIGEIVAVTTTKVWITSRPENDISRGIAVHISSKANKSQDKGLVRNVAVAKRNKEEIARYIEREIDSLIESEELLDGAVDEDTRRLIVEKLGQKGDGMYLWVHLQILSLSNLTHVDYVRQQLEELPQGLEDTYRVLFNNITSASKNPDRQNAIHALKWLCATTPLEFRELAELVKHTNSVANLNGPLITDTNYLHKICHNLVAVDTQGQQQQVRLTHLSIREFLETQDEFTIMDLPHEMAVKTCLHHLLSSRLASSTLIQYIAQNWTRHYRQAVDAGRQVLEIVRLTSQFLKCKHAHPRWLREVSQEGLDTNLDPLFTIARYNLHELCPEVLSNPTSFNLKPTLRTSAKQNPLHIAITYRHHQALKHFLTAPDGLIHVNAQDQDGRTPLGLAIFLRNHELVELLLTCPAINVNMADTVGGFPPLVRAAWLGDEAAVNLLVNARSAGTNVSETVLDLNAVDDIGRTALIWAIFHGETVIVQLLLEAGANVNARGETSKATPLTACAERHCSLMGMYHGVRAHTPTRIPSLIGDLEKGLIILRELCRHPGINPNVQFDMVSESMLSKLINMDNVNSTLDAMNVDAIKTLISTKSFDINAPLASWISVGAIHVVASEGNEDIMEVLLNHKPLDSTLRLNVNSIGVPPYSGTPLSLAVSNTHVTCVKQLLNCEHTVNLRIPDDEGKTPLQNAILNGSVEIAVMLIRHEGFVDEDQLPMYVGRNWDKLRSAAQESHAAVLEICNLGGVIGRNTHQLSSEIQEERDAPTNIRNVFLTVLRASQSDAGAQKELLRLNINVSDARGFSMLHYALVSRLWTCGRFPLAEERIHVVRTLLATPGIELNPIDTAMGCTPLVWAVYCRDSTGSLEIFTMLLAAEGVDVNAAGRSTEASPTYLIADSGTPKEFWAPLIADQRLDLNVYFPCCGGYLLGHVARKRKDTDRLRALLDTGRVDPNLRSIGDGSTALFAAVNCFNLGALKILLNHPTVEIDCPDWSWDTPLTRAAVIGDPKIVRALLRRNPNLGWKNHRGLTAMELAVEEGHVKIVELLNDAMDGIIGLDTEDSSSEGDDLDRDDPSPEVDDLVGNDGRARI